jgi:hypothetical protein
MAHDPEWGILGNLCQAVVSREHGWNSVRSMRYPEGIPEDDPPVTARGPLRRATARALLG